MLSSIQEQFVEVVHSIQGKRVDECFYEDLGGTMAVEEIAHILQFQGLQDVAQNQPTVLMTKTEGLEFALLKCKISML